MNNKSLLLFGGVVAGCVLLAVCGALVAGGSFFLLNGNPFAASAPTAVNRVAIVGNDFNIYVADPVTGATTALTTDGGDNHAYNYPTWSPDNRRLAFVGYRFDDDNPAEGILFTVTPTGEKLTPIYKTPQNFPFYLYWSPNSQFVGFLANKDSQNLALRIARSDHPDSMQEVDIGSPFYWAWAPDGSQLFTHVGGTRAESDDARLAVLDFESRENPQPLDALPGAFQAPQWSRDGKILYSTQAGSVQAIALSNAQGQDIQNLVTYNGRASFALSPDGTQVAYVITSADTRLPHFGLLRVIGVNGGEPRVVSREPVLAFFWSPDSRKLAYLTVTTGDDANSPNPTNFEFHSSPPLASTQPETISPFPMTAQGEPPRIQLHWNVWDAETENVRRLTDFAPTFSFLNVIPYFDQYANSSTFWSPDSKSFVYTARSAERGGEVFVADITGAAAPRKIADGVIAFWSWK